MVTPGRVVVQGPGAVGSWLATKLAAGGETPLLLCRQEHQAATLDLALFHGEGPGADELARARVVSEAADSPGAEAKGDLLVVCTKAGDVAAALEQGVRWIEEEGTVVVLANGVGHLDAASQVWRPEACLLATLTYGLRRRSEGEIAVNGEGVLRLGPAMPSAEAAGRSAEVAKRLEAVGIRTEVCADGRHSVWQKAALNAGLNPVASLLGIANGRVPGSGAFDLAVEAAREVSEVAASRGVDLATENWQEQLEELCRATAENHCSTHQDLEAKRPTEIGALCGIVDQFAGEAGIETPVNRLFAALVRRRELEPVA